MPIPRGCLSKSDFSRDFQSADHTAFFGTPEPEPVRESSKKIIIKFSPFLRFYSLLQGVDEVVKPLLSFPSLDNRTLVDQQLTFRVVHLFILGRFLSFVTTGPFRNHQKVPLMSALTVTLWRPSV
ncbi:hypothetical protein AVEN_81137-1 [Araneus ventricosus]|uniref:Uncharacterized protein n=1 Tax=Araneus ventricosus TaxID=182803 RepID=A0A4Y2HQD9_ARAVE|nr:hypothetical protein AVEN_81137-1 [Araneus ventricosus]